MSSSGFAYPSFQVSLAMNSVLRNLLCISEPIGSAKPKFSDDLNSKGMARFEGNPVALVCPAQAFPIPSFRSVIIT